jgi:hypothetical protein
VERLREFLAKRGVTIDVGWLVIVISANAVQATLVGLAATPHYNCGPCIISCPVFASATIYL